MNTVDIAVGVVLLISGVFALVRGFVHEILAAVGWVLAPLAAFWVVRRVPAIHELAHRVIDKDPYADILGGAVIFLLVLIVMSFFTHAVARRVQQSALGSTDRALGFAFGLLRGLVFCSLAFMVESWLIPQQPDVVTEAKSLPMIKRGVGIIESLVPAEFGNLEEQVKSNSQDLQNAAEQLKQDKDMYDMLQSPAPRSNDKQDNNGNGTNNGNKNAPDEKGLDRLIENTNGK
ncbi:MAG TPA: CvpA family protein [Magnetospirillaceae bacterium]|jgi:membrane protein required for colicin V production